jgi:hypothetical protein
MNERIDNIKQLQELLGELEGKEKANPQQLTKLFTLHNYFNPRHAEYGKHCPSCVARVYRQSKTILTQVINEIQ